MGRDGEHDRALLDLGLKWKFGFQGPGRSRFSFMVYHTDEIYPKGG